MNSGLVEGFLEFVGSGLASGILVFWGMLSLYRISTVCRLLPV